MGGAAPMSVPRTEKPAATSALQAARPMPLDAPVTMAILEVESVSGRFTEIQEMHVLYLVQTA